VVDQHIGQDPAAFDVVAERHRRRDHLVVAPDTRAGTHDQLRTVALPGSGADSDITVLDPIARSQDETLLCI
jgi:hypothetical protein